MDRRATILVAVVAAAVALVAVPAMAAEGDAGRERVRALRVNPPAWVDQDVDEIRERIGERAAVAVERISNARRLTDDQKAEALSNLSDALEAIAAVDEPAEVVGTAISRRQLQRIEWRGIRRGVTPDLDEHIAHDLVGDTRRFEHLTTITGWAASAGEDVGTVEGLLDAASAWLEVVTGNGATIERHDAVHIARAWMTRAHTTLMD